MKTDKYKKSKLRNRNYHNGKNSLPQFRGSASKMAGNAALVNKRPLPLMPDNGYDMFYQEVVDSEFFRKIVVQVKGSKKYD